MMGCNVIYIKPMWLIKEEERLLQEFKELNQRIITIISHLVYLSSFVNTNINIDVGDEDIDQVILKYRKQLLQEQA